MPGISDAIFGSENDKTFEAGIPLLFSVRVRVREEGGGNVVAEGKWEEVFTPVEGDEGKGVEIVETSWMCEDSSVGYSVCDFYIFYSVYFILIFLIYFYFMSNSLFFHQIYPPKKGSIFIK